MSSEQNWTFDGMKTGHTCDTDNEKLTERPLLTKNYKQSEGKVRAETVKTRSQIRKKKL